MSGKVAAIWLKRFRRGPMDSVQAAQLVAGRGLAGNADQGGKRQITIIDEGAWHDVERELDASISPSTRRANVMLSGVDLEKSRGRTLAINGVRVRIYGETRPCERMEEAHTGLRETMNPHWRGGAYGEVLDDGEIHVGDTAEWTE